MSMTRGELATDEQVQVFRSAAGFSPVMDGERIRAGLAAVGMHRVPLTDTGVLVVLQVLDAAMDALGPSDRSRIARAFTNRYGNEISHEDAPELTPKEWGVLRALADGHGTDGAATVIGVGRRTVSTHIESMLRKLNAKDRTQAVAEAFRRGML